MLPYLNHVYRRTWFSVSGEVSSVPNFEAPNPIGYRILSPLCQLQRPRPLQDGLQLPFSIIVVCRSQPPGSPLAPNYPYITAAPPLWAPSLARRLSPSFNLVSDFGPTSDHTDCARRFPFALILRSHLRRPGSDTPIMRWIPGPRRVAGCLTS